MSVLNSKNDSWIERPWSELTFVAFDCETSGAHPVGDEIVEVGLVKWQGGREIAAFDQLIRPTKPMGEEVIKIHGITNEMVAESPKMADVIHRVRDFIDDGVLIAHHAPFDLGFLVYDFEKYGIPLPTRSPLCSSLLSRKIIQNTENHKLQTLIQFLKINAGPAHRAESDARACLEVAIHCFQQLPPETRFGDLLRLQGKDLSWNKFSMNEIRSNREWKGLVEALESSLAVEFVYMSGSRKGETRKALPLGIVRSPDGDYLSAICAHENQKKRFYLKAIKDSLPVPFTH